ncbi:LruC domain-containing protein [Lunatimonas salinarum]|uniref:LruC domain-containing protein n=1 Tax=Lunatimonas salinarum TaxID=1774590 RepID=UPI001ADF0EFB|nr:LruC domain-containing protein [Lunatimonas salinarum]
MKSNSFILLLLVMVAVLGSCDMREAIDNPPTNEIRDGYLGLNVPSGFDFATTKQVDLTISAKGIDGLAIPQVVYRIYDGNPNREGKLMQQIRLNEHGTALTSLEIPGHISELWLVSDYIGVEPIAVVPATGRQVSYSFDAAKPSILPESFYETDESVNARVATADDLGTLGTWGAQGKPEYLESPDKISVQLLKNVNASLPERADVRVHSPEFLNQKYSRELHLDEDAEVWITYVHTGAGYRNVIGYYWYKDGEKPETAAEIKNRTVIYPNIQQGVLTSGDKVKLRGPMNGAFEKGTKIGWFLIADGWRGSAITTGRWTLYADPDLNSSVKEAQLRDHMVFLYDATDRVLLMGWEDIKRDESGCDHDFNDVVFYASWNPITSVDLSDYAKIDADIKDRDGDGVSDETDEYPDDASRAFNNYSPGQATFGTLLFEDLWPSYGDYDLNDLVVDYQVNEVSDAQNLIKEINFTTVIRATGAAFNNGFGVELPVPADRVESVKGYRHTAGYVKTLQNGVEDGQRLTTVIVADDVNRNLPVMSNVYPENPIHSLDTIRITIVFDEGVRKSDLGSAPYNPFMIVKQDRSREVHLMNKKPTDLMDVSLLGSGDDESEQSLNRFFVSKRGFNWALHVPNSIGYASEKVDFTKAYLRFGDWVKSGGQQHADWYLDIGNQIDKGSLF